MLFTIFLNLITVYFICSIFENLFIFFIVLFSLIVLNCEILSLLNGFSQTSIVIISFIEITASVFCYLKSNKKLLFLKFDKKIINALNLDKTLKIAGLCFIFMLFAFLFLAMFSLPLEPDNRMYHFVRIFEYIKQTSFAHFETNQIRNIIMPVNSEMIYSYFYIFKKSDFSFGLLSYFSFVFLITGLFNIFRELKIPIRKALFSIFIFSSFGAVLVQIPSLQTDILTGALIVASIYLFISGESKNKNSLIYFSSLSYALAIGVKTTAIMNFIGFFIIILGYNIIYKKNYKNLFMFFGYFILNFIIFSSYNYILNFIQFNNFIAPKTFQIECSPDNIIRNFKLIFKSIIFSTGKTYYDERTTGFSILGILVIFPVILFSVYKSLSKNKKEKMLSVFGVSFIINFILLCSLMEYFPYSVRFFVTYCAVLSPAFAFFYFKKNNLYKIIVIFLSVLNLILYSVFSTRCPLYYYFGADFKNLKKDIILNKQKNEKIKFQYTAMIEFKNTFENNDKILMLNSDDFYEIKQLLNYDIKIIDFDFLKNSNLKNYKYIILINEEQMTNNPSKFIRDKEQESYNCIFAGKKYKNQNYPVAQKCYFEENFLNKRGFKLTDKTKTFRTYEKI